MQTALVIVGAILALSIIVMIIIANNCFEDEDPDMYWYDETQVITCPHTGEKTDVVVNSCVTCETIHTICDNCSQVLNVRTDCT